MARRGKNKSAKFPELRDKYLKELGYYELAQEIGFNRLPSRIVGSVGGSVTRYFVEKAQEAMKQDKVDEVYSSVNDSAMKSIQEYRDNEEKFREMNPLLDHLRED